MDVDLLLPHPDRFEIFKRSRLKFIPARSGCYVLSNFEKLILYIGLTENLRNRMQQHLENPEKTKETELGRSTFFHWLEEENLQKLERTWINMHSIYEGKLPSLNRINSPISG